MWSDDLGNSRGAEKQSEPDSVHKNTMLIVAICQRQDIFWMSNILASLHAEGVKWNSLGKRRFGAPSQDA